MKRLLVIALFLVGCSNDPVAPVVDPEASLSSEMDVRFELQGSEKDTITLSDVTGDRGHLIYASCEKYKSKGYNASAVYTDPFTGLVKQAFAPHETPKYARPKFKYVGGMPKGVFEVKYTVVRQECDTAYLTGYILVK